MMQKGYEIKPIKIARSRKIQVKQFEPEEVYIEYELIIHDQTRASDAVKEATTLARAYLDSEEKRLRNGNSVDIAPAIKSNISKKPLGKGYTIEITPQGKQIGDFRISASKNGQYANFIHLWFKKNGDEFYLGHLRKDNGTFVFKTENSSLIDKYGIKKDQHFKIKTE